jgi:hypothetical protein
MRTSKLGIGAVNHAALVAVPIVLAVVVGCSGGGNESKTAAPTTPTTQPEDVTVEASDFKNLADMTPVRGFFVDNLAGDLESTLAVANNPEGGDYPVGSVVQLIPNEAMVKHVKGYSPDTNDWEYFTLDASPQGTKITSHGGAEIVNTASKLSCNGCHSAAEARFDFVCEKDHGCAPLPFTDDVIRSVQKADPRPKGGAATATTATTAG